MKVVISGTRTIDDKKLVWDALENSKFEITELVSGGAIGVDRLGEEWARSKNIPIKVYKPHYAIENPKYAPLIRNADMAKYGDALIAVWKDESRGTAHMIKCMTDLKKPVEITLVK
jgi:hypothetical protein